MTDQLTPTCISTTIASPHVPSPTLKSSPLRKRPPIVFNPCNAHSWVVTEQRNESGLDPPRPDPSECTAAGGRDGERSGLAGKEGKLAKDEQEEEQEEEEEDPFGDYVDYESDHDYCSDSGSLTPPVRAKREDSRTGTATGTEIGTAAGTGTGTGTARSLIAGNGNIKTITLTSDLYPPERNPPAPLSSNPLLVPLPVPVPVATPTPPPSHALRRNPTLRPSPDPPLIPEEEFPNSPSPFSPTPARTLVRDGPGWRDREAGSVWSRPSWQGDDLGLQKRGDVGRSGGKSGREGEGLQLGRNGGWLDGEGYGTFLPPPALHDRSRTNTNRPDDHFDQTIDGPTLTVQPWSSPIPISTPQLALSLPSAHQPSFGSPLPNPRALRSPYSLTKRTIIIWGPGLRAIGSLCAAVLMNISTKNYGSRAGGMIGVPNRAFTLTAAGDSPGNVLLGMQGWCLEEGLRNCTVYWDMAFGTANNVAVPADNTLRLADSALTISSLFLIFFACYSLITLILQIWLFNHAAVPFAYLSLRREEDCLDELYVMARRGRFSEVFWTWWGHRYSPIGHLFCLIASVTGIIGFACTVQFRKKLPQSELRAGAFVPLAVLIAISPCFLSAVSYFYHIKKNMETFSRNLELIFPDDGRPYETASTEKTPASQDPRAYHRQLRQNTMPVAEKARTLSQPLKDARRRKTSKRTLRHKTGSRALSTAASSFYSPPQLTPVLPDIQSERHDPIHGADTTPDPMHQYDRNLSVQPSDLLRKPSGASSARSGVSNNERWRNAYEKSPSLSGYLETLKKGDPVDPFILSEDGLLYIYIEEENNDMEVPRLVPPEGKIRKELIEDASWEVRSVLGGNPATEQVTMESKKILEILAETYWWDTMSHDVYAAAGSR